MNTPRRLHFAFLLLVLVAVGCGPSAAEVERAANEQRRLDELRLLKSEKKKADAASLAARLRRDEQERGREKIQEIKRRVLDKGREIVKKLDGDIATLRSAIRIYEGRLIESDELLGFFGIVDARELRRLVMKKAAGESFNPLELKFLSASISDAKIRRAGAIDAVLDEARKSGAVMRKKLDDPMQFFRKDLRESPGLTWKQATQSIQEMKNRIDKIEQEAKNAIESLRRQESSEIEQVKIDYHLEGQF